MSPAAAPITGAVDAGFSAEGDAGRKRLRAEVIGCAVNAMDFVLQRQRYSYPFIDTKFSLITGENFAPEDPLRGTGVVYSWIQGRGLESLAKHGMWLRGEASIDEPRRERMLAVIDALLPRVVESMERIRARCGGRLPFMADTQGRELAVDASGSVVPVGAGAQPATSLSDLFYSKGLMAASRYLGEPAIGDIAIALLDETVADLRSGNFRSGQVGLDPKNPVQVVPGRFSHTGRMIAIGAATLFYETTGQQCYADLGIEFIEYILRNHTLTDFSRTNGGCDGGADATLQSGDFWEFIDAQGAPWRTPAGQIWCDPGHATEFVGLSLEHLRATGLGTPAVYADLQSVLFRNFANGFSGMGLVKAFDLSGRVPINSDMPWWSLPETMRAAVLVAVTVPSAGEDAAAVFEQCWQAFADNYVKPELGCSAVQCIGADGGVLTAIPATPDADPGYHAGLSFLGCLPWFDCGEAVGSGG